MRRAIMLGSGMFCLILLIVLLVSGTITLFNLGFSFGWSVFFAAWDYKA